MRWIWCCETISPLRSIRWACTIPMRSCTTSRRKNIGLIEVMGLAVLPARLKDEMEGLKKALIAGADIRGDEALDKHADWVDELRKKYDRFTEENTEKILQDEIGLVFAKVLEHAGVYKRTPEGKEAFLRFVESVK